MKKKKLKKKIKKLEYRVNYICKKLTTTINALNLSESHVAECKEAIKKLEANPKLQMYRQCTWCKYYDSVINNNAIYYKCNCSSECINSDKFEMREEMD